MTNPNDRLTRIRCDAAIGPADAEWLLAEVERLRDRCAEFEPNLNIAERQVTEARNDLDRLHDTMRGEGATHRSHEG